MNRSLKQFDNFLYEWMKQCPFVAPLKKEYGPLLRKFNVFEHPTHIEFNIIVLDSSARGQGILTKIMNQVIEYANSLGKPISIYPDETQGTPEKTLIEIYKKFGFKMGKRPYLDCEGEMVRPPDK